LISIILIGLSRDCDHNGYMKPNRKVGARELKLRLGGYIRAVRGGETIVITERGEPVAELRPLRAEKDLEGRLDAMVTAGLLTRGSGENRPNFQPVQIKGQPISRTVIEEREDRL
jgi:prevent-host-death family protein